MTCPLISLVVPVYNVAPYLPTCLDSIIGQTYVTLEIILIDDGSTDGSGALCDKYAMKDVRIHTYHQKNGGLSAARNAGILQAHGDYIAFVDSDDCLAPGYVTRLYDVPGKHGPTWPYAACVPSPASRQNPMLHHPAGHTL
jgi:glycosyltransferase involved in cell wall biosynthesis